MRKITLGFVLLLVVHCYLYSQQITQVVRGTIVDKESNAPIEGASVAILKDSVIINGTVTDAKGAFRLDKIPVGRVNIIASYIGYKKYYMPNLLISSAKEAIMDISMETSIETKNEVVIMGKGKGEVVNDMAMLSAHEFSIEETERYAGSRGDPARMAENFAGVSGNDDSQNNLVVRGNSPFGVLYRIDDIEVPDPNHFAGEGQTGSEVAILSDRMLANSDFLTGAFPAEFGDAIAAIFDIRLRNGNNEDPEFTAQVGALGAEVFGEGPFTKRDSGNSSASSFIFNYRYSTLGLLVKMGVDIGTNAIPTYQDFQFKLNFPLKGNAGNISVFGIGGYSNVNFLTSNQLNPNVQEIYSTPNTDEYFKAGVGIFGVTYTHQDNEHEYTRVTIGGSTQYSGDSMYRVNRSLTPSGKSYVLDTIYPLENYLFLNTRYTLSVVHNDKINSRSSIRYGVTTEMFEPYYRYNQLLEPNLNPFLDGSYKWIAQMNNTTGFHFLIQPYIQWKYKISEKLTMVAGLHGQYFTLSNSWSIEPRFSIKWQFKRNQSLAFGTGTYSQLLPFYQYFIQDTNGIEYNKHLDFIRSYHAVLGYDVFLPNDVHIKVEGYFQFLWNIPVDTFPSSYNILDEGTGFSLFFPGKLVNKGEGTNMGLELTVEKYFTHNWFAMFTGSLYNSKLQGSNGLWYNSDFNSHYVFNLLGTKEFRWGKGKRLNTIGIGGKIMLSGGVRYTPYDTTLSKIQETPVVIDSLRDKFEFAPYFRIDLKLNYRCNTKRFTHEVGIDLVNVTGYKNLLRYQYVSPGEPINIIYQTGFLPIFYYRLDFGLGKRAG